MFMLRSRHVLTLPAYLLKSCVPRSARSDPFTRNHAFSKWGPLVPEHPPRLTPGASRLRGFVQCRYKSPYECKPPPKPPGKPSETKLDPCKPAPPPPDPCKPPPPSPPDPCSPAYTQRGSSGPGSLWQNYLAFTEQHPLKVQAFTAFLFSSLGNILSQTIVERRSFSNIDWKSVAKFTGVAVFISFPLLRSWLWILENAVKPGKFAPLIRVILDQLLWAPIFLAGFIGLMGFVEGTGLEDAKQRLKNDYFNVLMSNWKVWPAVQLINFYFVPFNQRILFGSIVSLFWNIYLAFVVRQGSTGPVKLHPSPAT